MTNQIIERKKSLIGLIHKVYNAQLKTSRKYTASTKTKSEVRGGGRKPWRQKGTGNARAGSIRSSIWVGGGVSFGPKPRSVEKKINKKEKRLAIFSAFALAKKNWIILPEEKQKILNDFRKTKEFLNFRKGLGIENNQKLLIILPSPNKDLFLATKNLKNTKTILANNLNLKELLQADQFLFDQHTFQLILDLHDKTKTISHND